MTTTIQKWGNSLGIRIPKQMAENANLSDGDAISIRESNGKITIEATKKKKLTYTRIDLDKMLAKITKKNRHPEFDWGPPQGKEIW
jgi:antitoxin MazE